VISTHKMLAAISKQNNAQIFDRESTQSTNTKTFFAMEEAHPATVVTDVVGGTSTINNSTANVSVEGGETDGVMMRILVNPTSLLAVGSWPDPASQDYMILVCGRSLGTGDANGCVALYVGNTSIGQMKVQPYYAVFQDTSSSGDVWLQSVSTQWAKEYSIRTIGEDYMFAAVKRGDIMEHYADGRLLGSVNVATANGGILADAWRNQNDKSNLLRAGHSGYGDQLTCTQQLIDLTVCGEIGAPIVGGFEGSANEAQDFYGMLYHFFPNGTPAVTEIENGMQWMKPKWIGGDKPIYPGWMF